MWWRKWRKEDLVGKWFPIFNVKNTPDRLSLSRSALRDADMYEVYIHGGEHGDGYLFTGMDGNNIDVLEYDPQTDSFRIPARLNITDITPEQVYGTHYYLGYRIEFDDLQELNGKAHQKIIIGIKDDQLLDEVQQHRFNTQELRVKDRMRVLDVAIELYIKDGRSFGISQIATQIHSHRWQEHPKKEQIKRELTLALDSFVDGGELTREPIMGYRPTGKAFSTQAEYQLQNHRHRDNSRQQRQMFWATLFAAIAAAGSAVAAIIPLFSPKA
ncbi:hypothetical protein KW823_21265 [Enterobacter quasiroggenkampii]|nr:hypothetical protein [Enterobacter quasiroggenkampii]